jgi:hypothetical protein
MKVFCTAFLQLQFGFEFLRQKNSGAKAARKIMVKLTPGGNFSIILSASFALVDLC